MLTSLFTFLDLINVSVTYLDKPEVDVNFCSSYAGTNAPKCASRREGTSSPLLSQLRRQKVKRNKGALQKAAN